ncbi:MAG: hypothetical protein JEZ06_09655 [Anaerolineaceae bacterium]|nr:hypothetical protein [Anaerolineaceae bacterium]
MLDLILITLQKILSIRFLLEWGVITLSFFNTLLLFWLGGMVILVGNRRSFGTWFTGGGMLMGALVYTSHSIIVGIGMQQISLGMKFFWVMSWIPAVLAPGAWYASILWYVGFKFRRKQAHSYWALLVLFLLISNIVLMLIANPLPSYSNIAGYLIVKTPSIFRVPILVITYVLYSWLCYLLPIDLLRRGADKTQSLADAARQKARPWLIGVSMLMFFGGLVLGMAAWLALAYYPYRWGWWETLDLVIKSMDVLVSAFVGLAITMLGRAIVAYEAFTGKSLPRMGFLRQWRSTVLLATGFSVITAMAIMLNLHPIYVLTSATLILTSFYVLYNWQTFNERENFIKRLRPFVSSQNFYSQIIQVENPDDQIAVNFFKDLCEDVLMAGAAWLFPGGKLSTLAGEALVYNPNGYAYPQSHPEEMISLLLDVESGYAPLTSDGKYWSILLHHQNGIGGVLVLYEKVNTNPFMDEEVEIARAGGERLLDLLAGVEIGRVAFHLFRQRLTQARVIEGQSRRVLHDDVLPLLHTAILHLSQFQTDAQIEEVIQKLSETHVQISDQLHRSPASVAGRLSQIGIDQSLKEMIENDYPDAFDEVSWDVAQEAVREIRHLQPQVLEVLFFACREVIRNVADHARGDEKEMILKLEIHLGYSEQQFRIEIVDNGIGFMKSSLDGQNGRGNGLRFHSALLAAVGGSLEIRSGVGGGTTAILIVPVVSG